MLFAQGIETAAAPLLQYGALGALVLVLLLVFLRLLPAHNTVIKEVVVEHRQTMRDLAADHKQAVEAVAVRTERAIDQIVEQNESAVSRICDEIKTCRGRNSGNSG
jgi:hypothetical protein